MCYLIAKEFDKKGCIAVNTRHGKAYDRRGKNGLL